MDKRAIVFEKIDPPAGRVQSGRAQSESFQSCPNLLRTELTTLTVAL